MVEESLNETNLFVSFNGNPYLLLEVCLFSIMTQTKVTIDVNDIMLGVNTILIKLTNTVLEDYKIKDLIKLSNNTNINDLKENKFDKIICIDNINEYEYYKRSGIENVVYYPINATDIFCDDEELEELQYKIYEYAREYGIDLENYSDIQIDKVIEIINNYSEFAKVVLLTKSEDTKNKFKQSIKNKQLYINENPYKQDILLDIKQLTKIIN